MKHLVLIGITLLPMHFAAASGKNESPDPLDCSMNLELAMLNVIGVECKAKEDPQACLEYSGFVCEIDTGSSMVSSRCTNFTDSGIEVVVLLPQPDEVASEND